MILIILLWIPAIFFNALKYFIKESIKYEVSKGNSSMNGIPIFFWKGRRWTLFRVLTSVYFLVPAILTLLKYGYWTAVIITTLISMISYGIGYARFLYFINKYNY